MKTCKPKIVLLFAESELKLYLQMEQEIAENAGARRKVES